MTRFFFYSRFQLSKAKLCSLALASRLDQNFPIFNISSQCVNSSWFRTSLKPLQTLPTLRPPSNQSARGLGLVVVTSCTMWVETKEDSSPCSGQLAVLRFCLAGTDTHRLLHPVTGGSSSSRLLMTLRFRVQQIRTKSCSYCGWLRCGPNQK